MSVHENDRDLIDLWTFPSQMFGAFVLKLVTGSSLLLAAHYAFAASTVSLDPQPVRITPRHDLQSLPPASSPALNPLLADLKLIQLNMAQPAPNTVYCKFTFGDIGLICVHANT